MYQRRTALSKPFAHDPPLNIQVEHRTVEGTTVFPGVPTRNREERSIARQSAVRGILFVAAIMGIVAAGSQLLLPTPSSATEVRTDCILSCHFGTSGNCGALKHIAPRVGDTHQYGEGWHDTTCYPGDCDFGVTDENGQYLPAKHPSCTGIGGDLDELLDAIVLGETQAIRQISAKLNAQLRSVPERDAIQVIGCHGEIVAHLPATEGTIAFLASE